MTTIAPTIELTLLPRSEAFAQELDDTLHVLIPSCMDRLKDRDAEAVREQVLMATSHLAAHITRLKAALESGEPDSFELERHLNGYALMRAATEYWTTADASNRWPAASEN